MKSLLLAILFFTQAALAGARDTGGGSGIMVGNRLVVLDLVEAGLENDASIPAVTPDLDIVAALNKNLDLPEPLKSQVLEPLAKKLTEIENGASHSTGILMASAFGFYNFHAVSYKLTSIDDVDSAIGETKIQLAVRKGPAIYISVPNWNQLDDVNRVALLMHEIIYAFQPLPTGCLTRSSGGIFPRQEVDCSSSQMDGILSTSSKARYMNAYFFQKNWQKTWKKDFAQELDGYSTLYKTMNSDAAFSGHIKRMRLDDDGTLQPVFSALDVYTRGGRGFITRGSTTAQLRRLCVMAELPVAMQDERVSYEDMYSYNAMAYRDMHRDQEPIVQEGFIGLNFSMDMVTLAEGQFNSSSNIIELRSIDEVREKCVTVLKGIQKRWF